MSGAFSGILLFWYSLWLGALLGVVYDVLRIRRIATARSGSFGARREAVSLAAWDGKGVARSRFGAGLVFLEDLLFAIFAAVTFLLLFYSVNDGVVRWYAFAGAGASFLVYRLTIGRLLMQLSDRIICGIRIVLSWFWRRLARPIMWLLLFPVRWCIGSILLALAHASGRYRERRLLRLAARGVLPRARRTKEKNKKEA